MKKSLKCENGTVKVSGKKYLHPKMLHARERERGKEGGKQRGRERTGVALIYCTCILNIRTLHSLRRGADKYS